MAIRLEPDVHATLSLIAQLRGTSITDEIRTALEAHIAAAKQAPELVAQADSAMQAVEAEAAARRDAISNLFGATPDQASPTSRTRGRRNETPEG